MLACVWFVWELCVYDECVVIESVGVRAMGECGGCVCVHGVVVVMCCVGAVRVCGECVCCVCSV